MKITFQNKIFLFVSSIVVALTVAITILILNHVRGEEYRNVESRLFVTQRVFNEFLQLSLNQASVQTNSFSESGRFKAAVDTKDPKTILQLIQSQQEITNVDFIIVTDNKGKILTNTLDLKLNAGTIVPIPIIKTALKGVLSKDLWSYNDKIYEVVCAPITISDYIFGTITTGEEIDDHKVLEIKELTQNEITFVVNTTISASTLNNEFRRELTRTFLNEETFFSNTIPFKQRLGNEDYFSLLSPLKNSNNEIVGYSLIQKSLNEASRFIYNEAKILFFIAVIAIVLSLLISFFIARSVTAPVNRLVKSADELAKGNYDFQIEVKSSDEIGYLTRSFDNMRISLRNSFQQLEKLNQDLLTALEELKNAQDELVQSERLSTIGSMASSIIHDFKNPMTVIKAYAQMLLRPNLIEDKKQKYSKSIVDSVDRLTAMAQELLEFARGETKLQKGKYKIKDIIDETIAFYALEFPQEAIKFNANHSFEGEIYIDAAKIKRVFENLIGNAIQAIDRVGTISIITIIQNGDLLITVSDTGKGIPIEIKEKLFEPFVTFGKSGGTGLGLAVTKKIITEHHGKIWVESVANQGTMFYISLPLQEKS